MTAAPGGSFGDLRLRVISAAVMLALGGAAVWAGGPVFMALVGLVTALMIWELAGLTAPGRGREAVALALLTGMSVILALATRGHVLSELAMAVPALALVVTARRDRWLAAAWALAAMAAAVALVSLRGMGPGPLIWILGVVIASDICGYFVGRLLGGPKFWPRVSPKKTWSGTVAGWLGGLAVGLIMANYLDLALPWLLILLSPVFALAGQMGDIAESWIKRRAGVKDSSRLIPGHGGVMDRFDALTGAAALAMCFEWLARAAGL